MPLVTLVSSPHPHNLSHILKTSTFGSSPPPFATSCLRANPAPGFWSSILGYFCSIKNHFYWKFLMTSDCIWFADWGQPLPPPTKNPGYAYVRLQEIFTFGSFPFQPIQKQCCSRAEDLTFSRIGRIRPRTSKCVLYDSTRLRISSITPPLTGAKS